MFKLYVSILSGIKKRRIEIPNSIASHVARALSNYIFILSRDAIPKLFKNYACKRIKDKRAKRNYKHSKLNSKSK